jgi:quinolinate synthase
LKILIAAHHYQRPEIIARASLVGDSYALAVEAARSDADYIVLCGVRFMAESAAILARPNQRVVFPAPDAGCPMADMIDSDDAIAALKAIRALTGKDAAPIVYMNSSAEIKAIAGSAGGAVCTSGNAEKILSEYLARGNPVFFAPDRNLGMNASRALGVNARDVSVIRRDGTVSEANDSMGESDRDPASGADRDPARASARVFLWDGFCHVHKAFTAKDVRAAREADPSAKIIVHPECESDVVALADLSGSTEAIRKALDAAPDGSSWTIGTEFRFVERMIATYPTKRVKFLRASVCQNMNKTDVADLDRALREIELHEKTGAPLNAIRVSDATREAAALALERMVRITEKRG